MLFFVILRYNYLYPYHGEVPLLLGNNNTNRSIAHIQINSLRRLLGLPGHNSASGMIVNLNIPSLGELLRKYVYSSRLAYVTKWRSTVATPVEGVSSIKSD